MSEYKGETARESINLARIEPFRLGALEIFPATRQMQFGERAETLEPRVMQVLVALAQAKGAVVTRDDLISLCWAGRIVGDNALHRTISRLRDISLTLADGCFRLETVNKVGYRLIALDAIPVEKPGADVRPAERRHVKAFVVAAITSVVALAALFAWTLSPAFDGTTIAIVSGPGRDSAELANGLAVDLEHLSKEYGNGIVPARGSEPTGTDYRLTVTEQRRSGVGQADVELGRSGSQDLLWSASVGGRGGDSALLRERAARLVSRVITCASPIIGSPAWHLNATLRLIFSACERHDEDADNPDVALWQRIVQTEPDNAAALAALAVAEAQGGDLTIALQTLKPVQALRSAAKTHFEKARSLNPRLGLSYAAEAALLMPSRYGDKLAVIERGLVADPDCAALHAMRSEVLENVGRMDDSIASAQKAVELEPSSIAWHENLVSALAYGGYTGAAQDELQAAERVWPDSAAIKETRNRFEFRFGNAAALVRRIDRGDKLPNVGREARNGMVRAFLLAHANPTPNNVAEAVAVLSRQGLPWSGLQNLVVLGRVEEAYAFMRGGARTAIFREYGGANILFRAYMRAFRLDGRFMPLANRIGLVQYWMSSDQWPDFCNDKDLPYNCRTEARRLHPTNA